MPPSASLNADVGEGSPHDRALIPLVDRVSIACGGHAGDIRTMRAAVALAVRHGVRVGAHPSYLDRQGFGRRPRDIDLSLLMDQIRAQFKALEAVTRPLRVRIDHVKLHGALYHAASADPRLCRSLALAIRGIAFRQSAFVAWIGPAGSAQEATARRAGLTFLREGFADRAYARSGGLVPRGRPGAVLRPRAAGRQAERLLESGRVDTLCVHSDTAGCVAIARAIRAARG